MGESDVDVNRVETLENSEKDELIFTKEEMSKFSYTNVKGEFVLYLETDSHHEATKQDNLSPYSDIMIEKVKAKFNNARKKTSVNGKKSSRQAMV
jgi:16S rRNA C1402 (ribose-2'-O) methylase RsmI